MLKSNMKNKNGKYYYFRYPGEENGGKKQASSLRRRDPKPCSAIPAVAVNPKDNRYKELIGKKVILPMSIK